ncbi:hypothetical protein [Acetobacterium wieringae]|uniref:hypothetical protein n=1 Tax=Acetobacterium wieringae TaxID=52694 RepID=UPI0020332E9B|nr:hypothetical protein [Acetobacterium wieringae]URN83486.1 hypothetical protein CHL1_002623 [Acetobacterium wieringae]
MIENVRKLNTADLFEFMRMVKRTGVKDELKKVAKNIPKKEKKPQLKVVEDGDDNSPELIVQEAPSQAEVGIDMAFSVMEIFSNKNAEEEIYAFIARPFQCTPEEVAENDLMDTIEKLKEVADAQKWASFFKSATQ